MTVDTKTAFSIMARILAGLFIWRALQRTWALVPKPGRNYISIPSQSSASRAASSSSSSSSSAGRRGGGGTQAPVRMPVGIIANSTSVGSSVELLDKMQKSFGDARVNFSLTHEGGDTDAFLDASDALRQFKSPGGAKGGAGGLGMAALDDVSAEAEAEAARLKAEAKAAEAEAAKAKTASAEKPTKARAPSKTLQERLEGNAKLRKAVSQAAVAISG